VRVRAFLVWVYRKVDALMAVLSQGNGTAMIFPLHINRRNALVVAAEAVDEAAIALGGAFGGSGEVEWAEEFALLGCVAAELFAGFGFAVEGLGDGGGAALLAEGEDFDLELAGFIFDVEHVADADLAGGLGRLVVRSDAVHVAGFGGLLAGLEEASGP
jgi:hypothetical protein